MIVICNRRTSLEKIQQRHPHAAIFDVTSRGPQPWVRFSPFYPHGGIPVPFSPGRVSASVEGIRQGFNFLSKDVHRMPLKNIPTVIYEKERIQISVILVSIA